MSHQQHLDWDGSRRARQDRGINAPANPSAYQPRGMRLPPPETMLPPLAGSATTAHTQAIQPSPGVPFGSPVTTGSYDYRSPPTKSSRPLLQVYSESGPSSYNYSNHPPYDQGAPSYVPVQQRHPSDHGNFGPPNSERSTSATLLDSSVSMMGHYFSSASGSGDLGNSPPPNIFGDHRAAAVNSARLTIELRQQPRAARSCGFGDRDRRVIDPPPIVELVVQGADLTEEERRAYQCFHTYVMQCTIRDTTGQKDLSTMPDEVRIQRRLMGNNIAPAFVGKDEHGRKGCFFSFPDLSCRTGGDYRLQFDLLMIPMPFDRAGRTQFPLVATALSDVFRVYNAKMFPGMMASSPLAKMLQKQGMPISIKKGANRVIAGRGQGRSQKKGTRSNDDDDDDDDAENDDDDGDDEDVS